MNLDNLFVKVSALLAVCMISLTLDKTGTLGLDIAFKLAIAWAYGYLAWATQSHSRLAKASAYDAIKTVYLVFAVLAIVMLLRTTFPGVVDDVLAWIVDCINSGFGFWEHRLAREDDGQETGMVAPKVLATGPTLSTQ